MGKKFSKAERLSLITKILVENPSKIFTLQYFSEILECAKSTLSEDIDIIENIFKTKGLGIINSISGAAGGIYYVPTFTKERIHEFSLELCEKLKQKDRIITGGYLYMNDIVYDPNILRKIARCMATYYINEKIDYIITIETKGIPIAITLGEVLNKPVVVVRKSARLTEGPTIQMNYVTGSAKSIKTMALPIKSIKRGTKVLFVDDFMKAGGTAKGIIDLMKEFDIEVVGVSVVMATKEPTKKLINEYYYLIELHEVNEETNDIIIFPNA